MQIEWVKIPSGDVHMGSSIEQVERAFAYWKEKLLPEYLNKEDEFKEWLLKEVPKQSFNLREFEVSETLICNSLFKEFIKETEFNILPDSLKQGNFQGDEFPIWGVKEEDIISFCRWYSHKTGYNIQIPTEAEWERAARGETENEYPWGNDWNPEYCNTIESNIHCTTPVKNYSKGKSLFGLYDMAGNVEEWVDTPYTPYQGGIVIKDDLYKTLGESYKILKGGSHACGGDLARVARRHGPLNHPRFQYKGFRIVR